MPRFEDEYIACLKKTMLSRIPDCYFVPEDYPGIIKETGLNQAQIEKWAEHLRARWPVPQDRENFLRTTVEAEKESFKLKRAYVLCFNVEPQFVSGFHVSKNKTGGEYKIKYMEGSFDKGAISGEFYIEFEEQLWYNSLLEAFEKLGACGVLIETFKHNDGNDSAANALIRVWESSKKTGVCEKRGQCSDALLNKAKAKQAGVTNEAKDSEFDEKTQAAIKFSMQNIEGKIDNVGDQVVNIGGQLSNVGDQVVNMGGQLSNVEKGMCDTLPKCYEEIEKLKAALAQKTLDCDRQEKKVADCTRIKNKLSDAEFRIWELEKENKQIKEINNALQAHETVKISLEKVNQALETAKWIIEEERSMKRPRTDSDI